jgi:hypothetical protein
VQENLVRFGDRLWDIFICDNFWAAEGVDSYGFRDSLLSSLILQKFRKLSGSAVALRLHIVAYSLLVCQDDRPGRYWSLGEGVRRYPR